MPARPLDGAEPDLERIVGTFVGAHRLPGASVGVVLGEDLVWTLPHGFVELEHGTPVDDTTLYRVASVTKTFTAAAVVQLRDAGVLHLDDPLVEHLPEFGAATNPYGPIEEVTIRRMLTHESGLPIESPRFDWAGRGFPPITEIVASLDEVVLPVPPDAAFKYSNLGYQLLGELVVRLGDASSYEEWVQGRLLRPLGMSASTFAPGEGGRVAPGHDARTFSDRLEPSAQRSKPTTADGGLYSTVGDLARWVSLQFRTDVADPGGAQVLAGRSIAEMHRPRRILDAGWTRAQALSWQVTRRGADAFVGHPGGTFGYSSAVMFHAGERVGAVVLSNGTGPAGILALEVLERAVEAVRQRRPQPPALPSPVPEAYVDLLGLYSWEDVGETLRVEWRDGELVMAWPNPGDAMQTLEPTEEPLRFLVRGGRETGEPCVFRRGRNGRIAGLTVRGWPLARLIAAE